MKTLEWKEEDKSTENATAFGFNYRVYSLCDRIHYLNLSWNHPSREVSFSSFTNRQSAKQAAENHHQLINNIKEDNDNYIIDVCTTLRCDRDEALELKYKLIEALESADDSMSHSELSGGNSHFKVRTILAEINQPKI